MVDVSKLPPSIRKAIEEQKKKDIEKKRVTRIVVPRGGFRGRTIEERQIEAAKAAAVPAPEGITQEVIAQRVAERQKVEQARRERILVKTPAEKALALAVGQELVKFSPEAEALRARRLAEEKQRITTVSEPARVILGGGRVTAEGRITPFAPERLERKEEVFIPPSTITAGPKIRKGIPGLFQAITDIGEEIGLGTGKPTPGAFIGRRIKAGISQIVLPIKKEFQEFQISKIQIDTDKQGLESFIGGTIELGEEVGEQLPVTRGFLAIGVGLAGLSIVLPVVAQVVASPVVAFIGIEVLKTTVTGEPPTIGRGIETGVQVGVFELIGKGTQRVVGAIKEVRFEKKIALKPEQKTKQFLLEEAKRIEPTLEQARRAAAIGRQKILPKDIVASKPTRVEIPTFKPRVRAIRQKTIPEIAKEFPPTPTRKGFFGRIADEGFGVAQIKDIAARARLEQQAAISKLTQEQIAFITKKGPIKPAISKFVGLAEGKKVDFAKLIKAGEPPKPIRVIPKTRPLITETGRIIRPRETTQLRFRFAEREVTVTERIARIEAEIPKTDIRRITLVRFLKGKKGGILLETKFIEKGILELEKFGEQIAEFSTEFVTIPPTVEIFPTSLLPIGTLLGRKQEERIKTRFDIRFIPDIIQEQAVKAKQIEKQAIKSRQEIIQETKPIIFEQFIPTLREEAKLKKDIIIIPVIEPITEQVPIQRITPRVEKKVVKEEEEGIVPKLPILEFEEIPAKKIRGFDSFVKVKGEFKKLNRVPLLGNTALNLALRVADQTPSVTAKVRPSGFTRQKFDESIDQSLLAKFEKRKDIEDKGFVHVEKNKFRIDSIGELIDIQRRGARAPKGKLKQVRFF